VNPADFIEILRAGSEKEVSDTSYKVLKVTDSEVLKSLVSHVDDVENFKLEIQGNGLENNQRVLCSLDRITRFLNHLKQGGCRCFKYKICSYMPFTEAKEGRVSILSEDSDPTTWETNLVCECVLCTKKYHVHEYEAGFGRRADWRVLS
jgi:hypothetical protein